MHTLTVTSSAVKPFHFRNKNSFLNSEMHTPDATSSAIKPFHFRKNSLSAKATMGIIDPAFVQELEHRPKLAFIKAEGIPHIDLSPLLRASSPDNPSNLVAKEALVHEVHDACKNWGFFQVVNHGVSIRTLQKLQLAARTFFRQSPEVKRKVKGCVENPLGYNDNELTKRVRDWKEVFDFTMENPTLAPASHDPDDQEIKEYINLWPQHPSDLREAFEEYAKEVQELSYILLELISLSLGLPANRLEAFFCKDQTSLVRLNHYPPCPAPGLALGCGRHRDGSALTIVAQDDVGGLEFKLKTNGEWIFLEPTPNAFVITLGNIIQVWSNGRYKSVEHRATVNSARERLSVSFFLLPAHYTLVEPLPELTDVQNPSKYEAYNWGKFLIRRKSSKFQAA